MNKLTSVCAALGACALLAACDPKPADPQAPSPMERPENSPNGSTPVPNAPPASDPASR